MKALQRTRAGTEALVAYSEGRWFKNLNKYELTDTHVALLMSLDESSWIATHRAESEARNLSELFNVSDTTLTPYMLQLETDGLILAFRELTGATLVELTRDDINLKLTVPFRQLQGTSGFNIEVVSDAVLRIGFYYHELSDLTLRLQK